MAKEITDYDLMECRFVASMTEEKISNHIADYYQGWELYFVTTNSIILLRK